MDRRSRGTRRTNRKNTNRRNTRRKARRSTNRKARRKTMRRRSTNRKARRKTMRRRSTNRKARRSTNRNARRNRRRNFRGGSRYDMLNPLYDTKNDDPNPVYVLHYSGTITGGKELRHYNDHVISKKIKEMDEGLKNKGTLLQYYDKYDNLPGGKKNEPFFDAFLVHMAHLNPEKYQKNALEDISYFQESVFDGDGLNNEPKSKFKVGITAIDLKGDIRSNYSKAKHIFILCPFAHYMVDEINQVVDERNTPIIIHIQGDAVAGQLSKDGGLTNTGGGMFGEAFNLFSGGLDSQAFRNSMLKKNANFVSVRPIVSPGMEVSYEVTEEDKDGEDITKTHEVPAYYAKVNDVILDIAVKSVEGGLHADDYDTYEKLSVHKVYQDGTDKDNLASLSLMNVIYQNQVVQADFIGFRIYASSSLPIGYKFLGYPVDRLRGAKLGYVPDSVAVMAPQSDAPTAGMEKKTSQLSFFPGKAARRALKFESPMGEFMKPAGDYKTGNVRFEREITKRFYDAQYVGFKEILDTTKNGGNGVELKNRGKKAIVDGLKELSASKRAPFNMSLYWFPEGTYMGDALIEATRSADYNAAIRCIKGWAPRPNLAACSAVHDEVTCIDTRTHEGVECEWDSEIEQCHQPYGEPVKARPPSTFGRRPRPRKVSKI